MPLYNVDNVHKKNFVSYLPLFFFVFPCVEEEEVDKMMEQKMKEEEERKRTKEIEERMSLEETKEQVGAAVQSSSQTMHPALPCVQSHDSKQCAETQVMKMGEKLQGLQEEKHQLFLQLKKVLHEEEKRRRKEQRCCIGRFLSFLFFSPVLQM